MNPELKQKWIEKLRTDPPETLHRGGWFNIDDGRRRPFTSNTCNACALGKLAQIIGVEKFNPRANSMTELKVIAAIDDNTPHLTCIIVMNDHEKSTPDEIADYIEKNL